MRRWRVVMLWIGAVLCLGAPRIAGAESTVVLPRPGQVGIGVQGGYGTMMNSGTLGKMFDAGPTFAVRLRYRMRFERGIGLSFEGQRLDAREAPGTFVLGDESTVEPRNLSLTASGIDFYQMFATRTRTVKMLSAGAGIIQTRAKLNDGDTQVSPAPAGNGRLIDVGDGPYLSMGAGVERFFFRTWAYDLSFRYQAVFRSGKVNHDFQIALGAIVYAEY